MICSASTNILVVNQLYKYYSDMASVSSFHPKVLTSQRPCQSGQVTWAVFLKSTSFPPHNLFSCSQTTFATMESISLHHTLLTMTLYLTTHRHRSNRSKPELVEAMDQNDPFFLEAVRLNLSRDEMCLIHKTGSEQCSCLCYHTHTVEVLRKTFKGDVWEESGNI